MSFHTEFQLSILFKSSAVKTSTPNICPMSQNHSSVTIYTFLTYNGPMKVNTKFVGPAMFRI